MQFISSTSNHKIKYLIKLRDDVKTINQDKKIFIEGFNMVQEALERGIVEEVYVLDEKKFIIDLKSIKAFIINESIAKKVSSTKNSQGIFAICKFKEQEIDTNKNILVLDDIQDPGNMGTLIRSALSFDFKNIIASPNSVNFFNDKVLRATQGMIFNINLKNTKLIGEITKLKSLGYVVFGTFITPNAKKINQINLINYSKVILILGNEGNGISDEISKLIDVNINITMNSQVNSLNVGVAGSIIMHEFYK